jgi:hypothetical protein
MSLSLYVGGGGLGGLVILAVGETASDVFSNNPLWIRAFFLSVVLIAGAFLARAYTAADWCGKKIDRYLEDSAKSPEDQATKDLELPENAVQFYKASTILVVVAALTLAGAFWGAAFSGASSADPKSSCPSSPCRGYCHSWVCKEDSHKTQVPVDPTALPPESDRQPTKRSDEDPQK